MTRLWIGLLALALWLGACGRYGPPVRTHTAEPGQEEEERQEQTTP